MKAASRIITAPVLAYLAIAAAATLTCGLWLNLQGEAKTPLQESAAALAAGSAAALGARAWMNRRSPASAASNTAYAALLTAIAAIVGHPGPGTTVALGAGTMVLITNNIIEMLRERHNDNQKR